MCVCVCVCVCVHNRCELMVLKNLFPLLKN